MKPTDLKLRCYAEQGERNTWFAICIDLNLAAQADTFEEVRAKCAWPQVLQEIRSDYNEI